MYYREGLLEMIGMSDASHNAFANATGQNCILIYMDQHSAISTFWSKREHKVTDSSSESESIAFHHLLRELEFIRGFMMELGQQMETPKAYCDNESVCIMANQRFLKNAGRNKYFRRIAFYINQQVDQDQVEVYHCNTLLNWADIGTKAMGGAKFIELAKWLFSRI
jgi:hypothetical protein